MARLAPIATRKQGQTIPVLTSRGALTNFLRQARAYVALRRARILLAFVSLQTLLLLISLTPQTTWVNLHLPNGPIPTPLTPLAAAAGQLARARGVPRCQPEGESLPRQQRERLGDDLVAHRPGA